MKLKQKRSTLYNKAVRSNLEIDWLQYNNINKKFRNEVRLWKRRQKTKKRQKIQQSKGTELMKRVGCLLKDQDSRKGNRRGGKTLDPQEFTTFMNTPETRGFTPTMTPLEVDEQFINDIEKAIRRSTSGKATGKDEVFVEAFRVEGINVARILGGFWQKCAEQNHIIGTWNTAIMVPIYKKGNTGEPSSYRPIALLSHAKKVIDKAIAYQIRKNVFFDKIQLGFTKQASTENAIVRTTNHFKEKRNYVAVLDLKMAYNSVPRNKLIEEVRRRVPSNVSNMITFCLQPMKMMTKGDITNMIATQSRGVPQGSTLSPTLYNIFMDTYPNFIRNRCDGEMATWSTDLFADNVKLQATTSIQLQELLHLSTLWASTMGMCWSPTKCNVMIPPHDISNQSYSIAGTTLETVEESEYLGVSINSQGLTNTRNLKRLQKARNISQVLRKVEITCKMIPPIVVRNISNAFIYGTAQYAVHLMPKNGKLESEWQKLDTMVIRNILGVYVRKHDLKLRKIADIPTLKQIRSMRLRGLEKRIERQAEDEKNPNREAAIQDLNMLKQYREDHNLAPNLERKQLYKNWNRIQTNHKRKLPELKIGSKVPALHALIGEYAPNITRWYLGSFPINPRYIIKKEGTKASDCIDTLRRLGPREEWTKAEERSVRGAIDFLMEVQPQTWSIHLNARLDGDKIGEERNEGQPRLNENI